jgi:hypothetical protein
LFAVAPDQVALHEAEHFMKVKASSVALARRTMREVDGAVLEKFI